jgi:hypothetical protein
MKPVLCAALSLFALAAGVRADEIRLKDGSKIVGSIVGFEDGSFKVETAYGFAMVRKDSISEIIPAVPAEAKPAAQKSAPGKPAEDAAPAETPKPAASAKANPAPTASKESKAQPAPGKLVETAEPKSQPAPVKPAAYVGAKTQPTSSASSPQPASSASSPQPASPQPTSAQPTAKQLAPQSAAVLASPAPAQPATTATSPAPAAAPASVPASAAPASATTPAAPVIAAPVPEPAAVASPEPPPVREMVRGNLYINQTYSFQMYRAPDWQPIIAARAALPNAIAALGTSDQSTLLIIGRDRARDSLDAQSAATEKAVEEIYENYRPMPRQRITVAGVPAIERQFRGEADHREWSVILVTLERDDAVFTILAMTDANSELVQIQENVIGKAIASLQFNAPTDPAAPVAPHT